MKIIIGTLLSIILIFWYIDIKSYNEQEKYTQTHRLSWDEAKIKIKYPNPKYSYRSEEIIYQSVTKTYIPLIYDRKIISTKKGYYLQEI